jgi:hypothetical protein
VLFLHQNLLGEQAFPVLQHCVALQVLLVLVSNPGWISLFLLVLIKGKLQLYQLGSGVELAHLPILVLLVQWRLCGWIVGPVVPLKVSLLIQSYISSLFASCFSVISSESSCRDAMRKLKSSEVRTISILVMVAFDFFREEGFRGKPFIFFRGSTSSPLFCSNYLSFNSSPSPPFSGDMEAVFMDALSNS